MKTLCSLLGAICTAGIALATQIASNGAYQFYSVGPDTYADGTPVSEGETYCLIRSLDGNAFRGFYTDGTPISANDVIVKTAKAAPTEDGTGYRCPFTVVNLPQSEIDSSLFTLVVLDTRLSGSAGKTFVCGYGTTGTGSLSQGFFGSITATNLEGNLLATVANRTPVTTKPVIKDIQLRNGKVYITLAKTEAGALYKLESIGDTGWTKTANACVGVGEDDTVTLEFDEAEGGQLFRATAQ